MTRYECNHSAPDEVVVERLVNGQPVDACRCEKVAAYHELRRRGVPTGGYAATLHMSGSTLAKLNRGEWK